MVDTNILVYAVNRDCMEHPQAFAALERWLSGTVPWALTWNILYEFMRAVTHLRVFKQPLAAGDAMAFVQPLLALDLVTALAPTDRRHAVTLQTVSELGQRAANVFHDLHTAPLMREHGVVEIMTGRCRLSEVPLSGRNRSRAWQR
jgi:predicted nucleic acid-binding protein